MKTLIVFLLAASSALLVPSAVEGAAPDPRDSVIVESKTVSPLAGACASAGLKVRVFITNKDSVANITIPFLTRSTGNNAYGTLSRSSSCSSTRSFANVFNWLIPGTALGSRIVNTSNYHSNSPDTFLLAATQSTPVPEDNLPPNLTRIALVDIKFDTATASGNPGIFEIDSGRVNANFIQFVTPLGLPVEVIFVRGVVTLSAPGCFVSNCGAAGGNLLYGRPYSFDFNSNCDPGTSWSVQSGPGSINSVTGVYSFSGQCPLGAVPVTVRATKFPFGFTDCQFTLNIVDNAPSPTAQSVVVVSHGALAANQISVSDPDPSDKPVFSMLSGPGSIDSNGLWSYQTGCSDINLNPQSMTARVFDGFGGCTPGPLFEDYIFLIVVTNALHTISNCPSDVIQADTNQTFSLQLAVSDVDLADSIFSFQIVSAPAGFSLSFSGLVHWTPSGGQWGLRSAVVRVTDGCGASSDCQMDFAVSLKKGDLNGDGLLTAADVVLLTLFAYIGNPTPAGAQACDLNCDNQSTPADVIIELNAVFLGNPFPC